MISNRGKNTDSAEWADPDTQSSTTSLSVRGVRLSSDMHCNDWLWIIFWAVILLAFIVCGIVALVYASRGSNAPLASIGINPTPAAIFVVLISICISLLLAFTVYWLLMHYPEQVIEPTMWIFGVVLLVCLVVSIVLLSWRSAILFSIALLLYGLFFYLSYSSLPFASAMLRASAYVMREWPLQLLAFSGFLMIVQLLWLLLWVVFAVSILGQLFSARNVGFWFMLLLLLTVYYWTAQLVAQMGHVTVSGVMSVWYWHPTSSISATIPAAVESPPPSPLLPCWRRALTTSFGTICLASLIVSIVNAISATIRLLIRDSGIGWCATCLVDTIVNTLESLVEWMNAYALCYVALYGGPYFKSAKLCAQMLKRRGLTAIFNDSLLSISLFVCALLAAILAAAITTLWGAVILPSAGANWAVWFVIGLVLGLLFCFVITSLLHSLIMSLFVCLADDPAQLQQSRAEIYTFVSSKMRGRYAGWEGAGEEQSAAAATPRSVRVHIGDDVRQPLTQPTSIPRDAQQPNNGQERKQE